jgi:hypothetical protein
MQSRIGNGFMMVLPRVEVPSVLPDIGSGKNRGGHPSFDYACRNGGFKLRQ